MKKCVAIFITFCLIICCVNAYNGNTFNSREYLDSVNENLEPFPRINATYRQFNGTHIVVIDTIISGFLSINSYIVNFATYPFRIIIWIFKMLYLVLPGLVWWQ